MSFGERLRELRQKNGLSMEQLGKEIGASSSRISDWENGKNHPSSNFVVAISEKFGVTTDWLLKGEEVAIKTDSVSPIFSAEWYKNYHSENRVVDFSEALRELISNAVDLSDEDVDALNVVALRFKQSISRGGFTYENKKRPPFENKGLTIGEKNLPEHYYVRLPLLGQVPAGDPITAIEQVDDYIDVPVDLVRGAGTYFVLRVKGSSMINANIHDGNLVIVKQQPDAENGEIVVAMTNEDDVTVKTFYRENHHVRLQPENDEMQPIITRDVKILGKVIGVYRLANH